MINFLQGQIKKKERIVKYIMAGGIATAVNLVLLYVLTDWVGLWYLVSAILAFIGGFFASFFLQKLWTFQDKRREETERQMTIFFLVAMINLAGNTFLMYLLVDIFRAWYMLAQVISAALIAIWNYNALRIFVFKPLKITNG